MFVLHSHDSPVWPSFDVGPQCAGCMEVEARELQQARKLENVKVVCSFLQCKAGGDPPIGVVCE